ncbi:unnamed protein product [Protopolystoma xenopodis]|uniref:Uncharacterized protein n=1 Tax=Protopolystoma xenopodis TaxID=117903 RepID=A0A448WG01_9PLAT|nr:unnamed protein product [Protopolystoma xenopodis]
MRGLGNQLPAFSELSSFSQSVEVRELRSSLEEADAKVLCVHRDDLSEESIEEGDTSPTVCISNRPVGGCNDEKEAFNGSLPGDKPKTIVSSPQQYLEATTFAAAKSNCQLLSFLGEEGSTIPRMMQILTWFDSAFAAKLDLRTNFLEFHTHFILFMSLLSIIYQKSHIGRARSHLPRR